MREMAYPSTVFRLNYLDLSTIVITCVYSYSISIKFVHGHEQSGKVEYELEKLKIH
jgi:hypothetical protein